MGLKEENLRLATVKAIADAIAGIIAEMREEHFNLLLEQYEADGNKQFSVKLPSGDKVATITLTEQRRSFEIKDDRAFLRWMQDNRPESVETVTVPPQPELVYESVKPRAIRSLLNRLDWADGHCVDSDTGEIVDGVVYCPAGRPKTFSVRYEADGRERVIDAWRQGELAELLGPDVLPQIGG